MRGLSFALLLAACAHRAPVACDAPDQNPGRTEPQNPDRTEPQNPGREEALEVRSRCAGVAPIRIDAADPTTLAQINEADSITLSRGACFGKCPIYSVTIRGDGRVTGRTGRFTKGSSGEWTIDPKLARRVLAELVRERLASRKASTLGQVDDLPSARLDFRFAGRTATIEHDGAGGELELGLGGPDNAVLTRLEHLVQIASEADVRIVGCPEAQ